MGGGWSPNWLKGGARYGLLELKNNLLFTLDYSWPIILYICINFVYMYVCMYIYIKYIYIYISIYIYIYINKWSYVIHNTQSAQISQKQDEWNLYAIMKSWKKFALPVITTVTLWQLMHHVPKCMSCHKVIVVITRRAHCFNDCIYIYIYTYIYVCI